MHRSGSEGPTRSDPHPLWNASKAELKPLVASAKAAATDFPDTLEWNPIPHEILAEIIEVPETFPDSFFTDQVDYLRDFWGGPRRFRVRKDQRNLTEQEWSRFLDALDAVTNFALSDLVFEDDGDSPLDAFVDIHVQAMHTPKAWRVHSEDPSVFASLEDGKNFLPWHREYLAKFEATLMAVNPFVTIPYWNWAEDPQIPEPLRDPGDVLIRFGAWHDPDFDPDLMPTAQMVNQALAEDTFRDLSRNLEGPTTERNHNLVHNVVGGTMRTMGSPAHPVFWLVHAFIDKLWADWQTTKGAVGNPPNVDELLKPPPIMTRLVANVVSTRNLGYIYA